MVSSSELETCLLSSDKLMEVEVDIAASRPSFLKPYSLKGFILFQSWGLSCPRREVQFGRRTPFRFRDRFQFPNETRIHLTCQDKKACFLAHDEVCFYEAAFFSGLRFLIQ